MVCFPKKIFLERSKSISAYRDLQNKDEVYNILKKNNYTFIQPEKLNFKDQIKLFSSAKKIVGLHGAAFANICFCNPKTQIVEFKTKTTGMNSGNIALKRNLEYKGIVCEAIKNFGGAGGR